MTINTFRFVGSGFPQWPHAEEKHGRDLAHGDQKYGCQLIVYGLRSLTSFGEQLVASPMLVVLGS